MSIGFRNTRTDTILYVFTNKNGVLIVIVVYVDDVHLTGNDFHKMREIVGLIGERFVIRVEEDIKRFLGFFIEETETHIKIHHAHLIDKYVRLFKIKDAMPRAVPMALGTDLSTGKDNEMYTERRPFKSLLAACFTFRTQVVPI